MSLNPSEAQRKLEEALYAEYEELLRNLGTLTKTPKELTLRRIRVIESELGLESKNYNGDF